MADANESVVAGQRELDAISKRRAIIPAIEPYVRRPLDWRILADGLPIILLIDSLTNIHFWVLEVSIMPILFS